MTGVVRFILIAKVLWCRQVKVWQAWQSAKSNLLTDVRIFFVDLSAGKIRQKECRNKGDDRANG